MVGTGIGVEIAVGLGAAGGLQARGVMPKASPIEARAGRFQKLLEIDMGRPPVGVRLDMLN
jgi:hypothetical protein